MATVTIGGRTLEVWDRNAPGGLGRSKKAILAEAALKSAKPEELPDRLAQLVYAYVGENENVTIDWLLEVLPADCSEVLRACAVATGLKLEAPGEAKRP